MQGAAATTFGCVFMTMCNKSPELNARYYKIRDGTGVSQVRDKDLHQRATEVKECLSNLQSLEVAIVQHCQAAKSSWPPRIYTYALSPRNRLMRTVQC